MNRFLKHLSATRNIVEPGKLARDAGGRFRDIKSCLYSPDLEELAQIAGEAQDADGNFIKRTETIGPNLREARSSPGFKQAQRNVLRQMEIEASV